MADGPAPSSSAVEAVAADAPGLERTERWLLPALSAWFRLEVHGAVAALPDWSARPSIFVMNHTAILGVEVYLLYAALRRLRPELPRPRTTVWPPFLEMPGVGAFYRAGGCLPMSVTGASAALRAGQSVLVLPEGPDATDVRDQVGTFHAGFLRVVRAMAAEGMDVPVVPFGWAGVDEANPWWVTTRPGLVRLLMKPFMPRFDFALVPRPPLLRPSKVVFVAGEPMAFAGRLDDEPALRAEVARVRGRVVELVAEATQLREEAIEASPGERLLHAVARCRRIAWQRR
jgi:1-acyl-sn-glycerol-3-phosphate acyltransferase